MAKRKESKFFFSTEEEKASPDVTLANLDKPRMEKVEETKKKDFFLKGRFDKNVETKNKIKEVKVINARRDKNLNDKIDTMISTMKVQFEEDNLNRRKENLTMMTFLDNLLNKSQKKEEKISEDRVVKDKDDVNKEEDKAKEERRGEIEELTLIPNIIKVNPNHLPHPHILLFSTPGQYPNHCLHCHLHLHLGGLRGGPGRLHCGV